MQPPGNVGHTACAAPPTGWLAANGAAVSRTVYAALFAAIGTTYGAGDGVATFNVPDLRGLFIRSLDAGRGVDTARALGSFQSDMNASHTHAISGVRGYNISINDVRGGVLPPNNPSFGAAYSVSTDSSGGSESRPKNIALLAIIKY